MATNKEIALGLTIKSLSLWQRTLTLLQEELAAMEVAKRKPNLDFCRRLNTASAAVATLVKEIER